MRVLTAAEMREADRRTVELGIPDVVLMENAGHRVVEHMEARFGPLARHRIVIFCGKGNNGGDGYVVARQIHTRFPGAALDVVAAYPDDMSVPRRMAEAAGCRIQAGIGPEMRYATLIVDALLGTGLNGVARGRVLELIREINGGFPLARVVAVDVPSGMNSDGGESEGEVARADLTVTFAAPKPCHVLAPNCDRIGELRVGEIGTPAHLLDGARLSLTVPRDFRALLRGRPRESNKGRYGHVLVAGGAEGKTGAAEMAGLAALHAGAGLVTVASTSRHGAPELMRAALPQSYDALRRTAERMNVIAIGPGLGAADWVIEAFEKCEQPLVIDADALNSLAGREWPAARGLRVLTPHPGEMARLTGLDVPSVQRDRLGVARRFAAEHNVVAVLKGHRTVTALPDGEAWVNPTGSPALSKGGTGDILTGLIAGFLAQHPDDGKAAVTGAVYLHGLAGEIGASITGDTSLLATDLLRYLPQALRRCAQ